MRLFTGLDLPPAVFHNVEQLLAFASEILPRDLRKSEKRELQLARRTARQPCYSSPGDGFVQQGDGNANENSLNEPTGRGFEAEAIVDIHGDELEMG
jgi:hypothetical protein